MGPRHPGSVRISCAKCGLEVERLWEEPEEPEEEWLCPDCDPDKGENETEHDSVWDDAVEDGITPDYLKSGWHDCKPRPTNKEVPAWVTNLEEFREVILAHPQAKRWAKRWALIVYYYYRMDWPAEEVGRQFGLSASRVKKTIRKLDNRAAKLRERKKLVEMPTAEELKRMSVRQIAARLKCSVGKAHALKKLARSA